ncbi:hypothetical protein [Burkholderia cenocepacia]|uniref:hypothetical protein n=1 Tax=Burkholderia cenocepacia TaxID=95486 RepID=UPI0022382D5E|nr:hypothetical protein [Burkholderia cenocepacia]MCW5156346.1 hypothetical protein [Burkholderia cenocepacia]
MKKNNDHTALKIHEEEFDFFKISKPKQELVNLKDTSKQEPSSKFIIAGLFLIAFMWNFLGQVLRDANRTEMQAFCVTTKLDTKICSTGKIGPEQLNAIIQRVQEEAVQEKIEERK